MNTTTMNEVVDTINAMGNLEAKLKDVEKLEGNKIGICVQEKGSTVGVVIYPEQFEAEATTVGEITGKVIEIFESRKENIARMTGAGNEITEKIKNCDVHAKLVPHNDVFLSGKANREFLDMNIIYYVCVGGNNDGIETCTITTAMCEAYGVTEEELFKGALNNITDDIVAHRSLSSVLTSFGYHIDGVENPEEIFEPFTVLTNRNHTFGASLIIKEEVLDKAMERMHTDELIILPSSIHEVLVINANAIERDIASFREMVKTVNDTTVKPSEILSYNVYTYNKNDGLRIAE